MKKENLLILLFLILGLTSYAVEITFNVEVPEGTNQVYIIGNDELGNWQANEGGAILMTQVDEKNWTITVNLQANTQYYYMFLCGPAWAYEQSPNVSTSLVTGTTNSTQNNVVTGWSSIPSPTAPITFNVTVPSGTTFVYLMGDDELGDWNADEGYSFPLKRVNETTFTTTIELTPNKTYQYKYLSGPAMEYLQTKTENFSVNTENSETVNDEITAWQSTLSPQSAITHYLKRDGNKIVDADGNNYLLKSIGLGNYMVWEPYMWQVSNYAIAGTMQQIVERMKLLLTPEDLNNFVAGYMDNYMTKEDVDSLKAWGFNSIRLPMHYNLYINSNASDNSFIERGFEMTERLRQWCADNEMYLILDLHAAPGGQGGDKAIADSKGPGLWTGDENGTAKQYQDKMVILWRELARRFADKDWIGGYDILNEPNFGGNELNLLELYQRCINQIRLYDQTHIIYLEGNWFANDFSTISPNLWNGKWDENVAFSPHKYWAVHDGFSGENIRANFNVPLYLGETGENSNEWFYQNVKLAESKNIGWAWWSYKKIDNISGFVSINASESFNKISKFINDGTGLDPNDKAANNLVFLDFLEEVKLENSKINWDVLYALIDQQADGTATRPYAKNSVPGIVHATDYDMGRNGYAYYENNPDQVLERVDGHSDPKVYNAGWSGRNDAVDIERTGGAPDPASNGYNIGWTNSGEWVQYTVNAENSGTYKIRARVSAPSNQTMSITVGSGAEKTASVAATGGWTEWKIRELGEVQLQKGENVIRVKFNSGGVNMNYLIFDQISSTESNLSVDNISFSIKNNELFLHNNPQVKNFLIYNISGYKVGESIEESIKIGHLAQGVYVANVNFINGKSTSFKFYK